MDIKNLGRNRASNILLWGAAAALVANLAWRVYKVSLKVQAASPVYTVIRTEKAFDKAGNLRYTNEYVDAVRSDGSVVSRVSTPIERQRRIAFASGDGILINELIGKKSTYPKNFPGLRVKRDPDTSCSSEFDAKAGIAIEGTNYVGGHRALRFGQVGGHGAWKGWYVPDVGCALVQMRLEHDEGVTVQQLASLTLGEPDPSLFQIPASLEETPPSGLYVPNCWNGKCDTISDSVKASLDKRYYDTRSQAR
jgi:hypothetical protein